MLQAARAQPLNVDALAAPHDAASRAAISHGLALRVGHVLRAAQRLPVVLHHRGQHLLVGGQHSPWKACRTSASTPRTFNDNSTGTAGTTRSAGFMRDVISVVPFSAC